MKRSSMLVGLLVVGCASPEGQGLHPTGEGTGARVKFDMFHRPLPDGQSATLAKMLPAEQLTRELAAQALEIIGSTVDA